MGENEHQADADWRPNRTGPWAALDAGLLRNAKLERLPRASCGLLYVACVLHCADELTDGFVPAAAMRRLLLAAHAKRPDVVELVASGLLVEREDASGWDVHGYLEWNPPRAYWEHQKARNASKQAAWRERQRAHVEGSNPERNPLRNRSRNRLVAGERDETREVLPLNPRALGTNPRAVAARSRAAAIGTLVCPECGVGAGLHVEGCLLAPDVASG